MTRQSILVAAGIVVTVIVLGWLMFSGTARWRNRTSAGTTAVAAPAAAPAPPGRKIKALLFYVATDGMRLTGVERDVAYGDGAVEQAREIITAQIAPVAAPLVSAVPAGTTLRALFLTERGDAFVDLSRDIVTGHAGGSLNEALTVYALVNALTANLPAVTAVQILIEGKEAETLSGHVDLRRPLTKNLSWVQ